jgi:hypothetical protein
LYLSASTLGLAKGMSYWEKILLEADKLRSISHYGTRDLSTEEFIDLPKSKGRHTGAVIAFSFSGFTEFQPILLGLLRLNNKYSSDSTTASPNNTFQLSAV